MLASITLILKSIAVGIANVIPGVSGGTMAFILGIYEELTEAVGNFIQNKEKRRKHIIYLLQVGIGVGIGIVIFAKLFTFLLESRSSAQYTYSFFLGLIFGSVPFVFSLGDKMKLDIKKIIFMLIAISLVLATMYLSGGQTNETASTISQNSFGLGYLAWLAVCGFLAAGSMVLPGFSGSALLIGLGEYANILAFVDNKDLIPVAAVAFGAVPGVIVFAKLISYFLKKFPNQTYYFIIGLLMASGYIVLLEITKYYSGDITQIFFDIIFALVGGGAAFFSSKIKR